MFNADGNKTAKAGQADEYWDHICVPTDLMFQHTVGLRVGLGNLGNTEM